MSIDRRLVVSSLAVAAVAVACIVLIPRSGSSLLRPHVKVDGNLPASVAPYGDSATTHGGASGVPQPGPVPPEPTGTTTSPSGQVWRFGEKDELGYTMPLDVRRPRPVRELPPAQSREEILSLREHERMDVFEEYRLGPDDGHTQNETAIDADGDVILAAYHRFGDGGSLVLGVSRSTDGGHSWTDAAVGDYHTVLTDPCVKSAGGGRWVISYLAMGGAGGSDYDVFARSSTNGGLSWTAPVAVTNDGNFDDKPYIATRGNEIVVGYADFATSPAKVHAVRSTNGGASFDHDIVLANNSVGGNGACPVIDPSGAFHVFWRDSYQDSLWVSHSTDHGATWSADRGIVDMHPLPNQLPPGFRMVNLPSAAADPISGAIVVVWNDQRYGDPDILSIRSTDGGHTWSAPIRVNDDSGTTAQFFPWIAFDPYGVAHVCWYDRRGDGSKIDVYYARSINDGQSFEANIRVTAQPYTPVLPWDVSTPFIGDYNAIAANSSHVFPCYQDAREGNQDVFVALLPGGSPAFVDDQHGPTARPEGAITAAPAVFSDRVLLRADYRAGSVIDVFSSAGRRVGQLSLTSSGEAWWDGRDAAGRTLPSGVYFARLRTGDDPVRIVKLR
jgi:hypothetical protein